MAFSEQITSILACYINIMTKNNDAQAADILSCAHKRMYGGWRWLLRRRYMAIMRGKSIGSIQELDTMLQVLPADWLTVMTFIGLSNPWACVVDYNTKMALKEAVQGQYDQFVKDCVAKGEKCYAATHV